MTEELTNPFEQEALRSAVGRLHGLPFGDELDEVEEAVATAVSSPGYE